jgi:NAD(P)-dependent dehydrogenase (short-subunit alcohol dehydrogenase family)
VDYGLCASCAPRRTLSDDGQKSAWEKCYPSRLRSSYSIRHRRKAFSNGTLAEWLRYGGPGYKVYGRSKLCNLLFTRELVRRLAGTGVTVNVFILGSLPPGSVTRREV